MKTAFLFIGILLLLSLGCTKKSESPRVLTHTYKLQRPLSIAFKSSDNLEISKTSTLSNLSVKIFLKKEEGNEKEVLEVFRSVIKSNLQLNVPKDLTGYTYIVAVAEGSDELGNQMSAVDTFKIGEQDLINKAKKDLKNRN